MSFFGKGKKEDLKILAEELGLNVAAELKVIDIKNLITSSKDYDVEFVKEMLNTIINDRLEREENERQKRENERQKKEREFELARQEKEREFELAKQRLEIESRTNGSTQVVPNATDGVVKVELQRVIPKFDPKTDDISLFLELFERQAKILQVSPERWVTHLIGILPAEVSRLIAREPEENAKKFEYVKSLLLKQFKVSPEKFRQMYVKLQKSPEKTWQDFHYQLKVYFEGWLEGLEIKTFEQLKDLMLTDQIKKRAPLEFKDHFLDEWVKIVSPVELTQKIEEFEDVRKSTRQKTNFTPQKETYGKPYRPKFSNDHVDRYKMENKFSGPSKERKNYENKEKPYEKHYISKEKQNDPKEKNKNAVFETRKPLQCYECQAYDHIRPQCPRLKGVPGKTVNRVKAITEDPLLDPYTVRGRVNGVEMPVLRDTGATVDVICQKYVTPDKMTGETVWVKNFLDEHSSCLPIAKVELDCELGHVVTKAAVVPRNLDHGRYLLGNYTATLLEDVKRGRSQETNSNVVNAVVTRAQVRKQKKEAEEDHDVKNTEFKPLDDHTNEEKVEDLDITDVELELLPPPEKEDPVLGLAQIDSENFLKEQKKCKELDPLFKIANEDSNETREYKLLNGKHLVKKKIDKTGLERNLLVVPENLREQVKRMCHEGTSGHLGVTKTKSRLAKYFFWPKCYQEVEDYVRSCDPCQRAGKARDQKKSPLTLVPVISEVFSKINVDACGPLPTTPKGNRYLITAMCLASKYPDAVPVENLASTTVVEALLQIFSRMGFPKEVQTDQGTSFMSNLTVEFLEGFGIKVMRSSVYHPQSNPVERFHRTLKRILRVLCIEAAPEWERHLPSALFALRTVTHESTGFSPSELVHGKNLRTPVTLLYEKWTEPPEEENSVVGYVFELINRLRRCQELAVSQMEEKRNKQKVWYDKKAVKREFQEGDLVLVLCTSRPNKLAVQWKGPGRIEKKLSPTNYVVNITDKNEKNQVYHANMLKPYFKRPELVNVVMCVEGKETNDLETDFHAIENDPNIFDFDELKENSKLEEKLNSSQINQLYKLLNRFSNIFSNIPGKTTLVEHDIELLTDKPVRAAPYRMSPRQTEILKGEIQKMLQYKVIEMGESDYTSPMILVEVPGKDPRPCIDYRRLNKVIRTEYFPLPNIERRVEVVAAARYITVLDLAKGYWQIPLSDKSQRIAAFVTSFGTYRPLRMPFGLKNAPYYFSKLISELLHNCEDFAVPYIDDIAIYSETWEEHLAHIERVLVQIQKARLTIKPNKCKFAQDEVHYLGHLVGRGKRTPAQLKIKAIQEFPTPKTKTQVRAFLGLAGYYRQYIPMFSALAAPLTETLKGKTRKGDIMWNPECEESFVTLKDKLSNKPVLYAPNFKQKFILQTDASDTGFGIILAQLDSEGKEHPVLYLSKKFKPSELSYCTTEKECAAIVYAIKKLQLYLDCHTDFVIQTDHNPLVWLKKNSGVNPRLLRWALALQPFNYSIEHKKGREHCNVDCLSRI